MNGLMIAYDSERAKKRKKEVYEAKATKSALLLFLSTYSENHTNRNPIKPVIKIAPKTPKFRYASAIKEYPYEPPDLAKIGSIIQVSQLESVP